MVYEKELAEFRRLQEIAGRYPPKAVATGGSPGGTQAFLTKRRLAQREAELEEQEVHNS